MINNEGNILYLTKLIRCEHKNLTELSKPRVISIRKNNRDHTEAPGIVASASGYVTKTSPGPTEEEVYQ